METNGETHVTQTTSSRLKPIETRRLTDPFFILLFPINLFVWIKIGFCDIHTNFYEEYTSSIFESYPWIISIIYATTALIFITLLVVLLSKLRDKGMFILVMIFIAVVIASLISLIITQLFTFISHFKFLFSFKSSFLRLCFLVAFTILTYISLMYHVTIGNCVRKMDTTLLARMINKPSRAILGSFLALLFSILIVLLSAAIWISTARVIVAQLNTEVLRIYLEYRYFFWLRLFIFAFAGTYLCNLVWNFGFTVMGYYFTYYYNTFGNQKGINVIRGILKVVRYHFGTVSFLSMPIVPSTFALNVLFKKTQYGRQPGRMIVNFISKFCLIVNISDFASIQTSIHGYEAFKSIKEMFDLRDSDSIFFSVGNAVSYKIAEISIAFAVIAGLIIDILIQKWYCHADSFPWEHMNADDTTWLLILYAFESIVSAGFMCKFFVRPAMCTFSIYKMTSLRKSAVSVNPI